MHLNDVSKYLGNLMRADQIRAERKKNQGVHAATGRKDNGNAKNIPF